MTKVALVYNLNYHRSEREIDFDSPITIKALVVAIQRAFQCVPIESTEDIYILMRDLQTVQPDIIFNVAEGFHGAAREAFYPALFEQMDIPYTGPGPTELLITHNKALTKRLLQGSNIPMAESRLITKPEDVGSSAVQIFTKWPVIIKLNTEGSSLGMDEHCITANWQAFAEQTHRVLKKYASPILAESYIPGRDISTTFIEGMGVFGPVEYTYPNSTIYDSRLKGPDNDQVKVSTPKDISEEIKNRLHLMTKRIVDILDINGYCRVDYRLSKDGIPYFLEVNGQVSFHPDGAFVLAVQSNESISFDEVVLHILTNALKHKRRISRAGITDVCIM
ncbi:MAG: hypothetical protein V9G98_08910 [Candidatus Competibacter sp.]